MRCICYNSNPNILNREFMIRFRFLTKQDDLRYVELVIKNGRFNEQTFRTNADLYSANRKYLLDADPILGGQSELKVTTTDFPLELEVTFWVREEDNSEYYIPEYNTPVILPIPTPTLPFDRGPSFLPMIEIKIEYNNGQIYPVVS